MGADYVIRYDCELNRRLGAGGLSRLVKLRWQIDAAVAEERRRGNSSPTEELMLRTLVRRPTGPTVEEQRISELLPLLTPLEGADGPCASCPANANDRSYGCIGYVRYPMASASEAWLMNRLPRSPRSFASFSLIRTLRRHPETGSRAAAMRRDPEGRFFEERAPITATIESHDGVVTVTSDQCFDILFGSPNLPPAAIRSLAVYFGFISDDLAPAAVQQITTNPERFAQEVGPAIAAIEAELPALPQATLEVARYLLAFVRAGLANATMSVDA